MKDQEEKAKFFALYWLQKVAKLPHMPKYTFKVNSAAAVVKNIKNWYLLLTPLSDITDEGAVEVAKICGFTTSLKSMGKWFVLGDDAPLTRNGDLMTRTHLIICDYLRSKGYALPYLNHSVEDQIKKGWIKLREK